MQQERYFIRDCNGKIVGNPSGYRTHNAAFRQSNMRTAPAYKAIWQAFYDRANTDDNLVSTIKLEWI